MAESTYTFYPKFQEFVTLYRGVVRVWLGDGTTGDRGVLYAEFMDGLIQRVGPVSSFAEAAQSGKAGPGTAYPTEEDWVDHIIQTTQHALDSESWATGCEGGEEVESGHQAYHNNSKYYAEQAHGWTNNAEGQVDGWSATNNAKYYAEQAGDANTAAQAAQTNAETAEDNAEAWAVGQIDGTDVPSTDPRYENNAKYYALSSIAQATAAAASASSASTSEANALAYKNSAAAAETGANTAKTAAQTAQTAAETAQTAAELAQTKAETAQNLAEDYRDTALAAQQDAETAKTAAQTSATAASQSASAAAQSATSASSDASSANASKLAAAQSETNALASETAATSAKDRAVTAETNAVAANTAAQTAKTDAQTAKTGSESARDRAEAAIAKYPYVSMTDYNWYTWNTNTNSWQSTGVDARGIQGPQGPAGRDGAEAVIHSIGTNEYSFSINNNGELVLTYNDGSGTTSVTLGTVRGGDGRGVIAGGTTGQALVKNSSTDYDTVWRTVLSTVNQVQPDQSGNVQVNTGVMTINSQTPTNGNFNINTGVMTINSVSPTSGNVDIDTGVMRVNNIQPTNGNVNIDTGVMQVSYDTVSKKITKTISGTTTDVVTAATLKTDLGLVKADVGLGNVENKSSATIRGELTAQDVAAALGYTPAEIPVSITNAEIDALFE